MEVGWKTRLGDNRPKFSIEDNGSIIEIMDAKTAEFVIAALSKCKETFEGFNKEALDNIGYGWLAGTTTEVTK